MTYETVNIVYCDDEDCDEQIIVPEMNTNSLFTFLKSEGWGVDHQNMNEYCPRHWELRS